MFRGRCVRATPRPRAARLRTPGRPRRRHRRDRSGGAHPVPPVPAPDPGGPAAAVSDGAATAPRRPPVSSAGSAGGGAASSAAASSSRTTSRTRTAPALSSGSLPLPHFGDCTQDGQPLSHSQLATVARVAVQPFAQRREAALGETRAAGVAVVDEDRRAAGVRVQRGRHAAEVPAVAGGEQRQDADRGVLGGVQRAGQRRVVDARPAALRRRRGSATPPACAAGGPGGPAGTRRGPRRCPAAGAVGTTWLVTSTTPVCAVTVPAGGCGRSRRCRGR